MVKDKDNLEAEHQHLLNINNILGSEDAGLKRYILSGFIYTKQWEKVLKMINKMERAYTHATKQVSDDIYAVCKDIPSIIDINTYLYI